MIPYEVDDVVWDGDPVRDLSWQRYALCAETDPEAFYPESTTLPAKQVCAACPVQTACLEYAVVTNQQHGVWAGTTLRDRRQIRLERGLLNDAA